jgi:hypothetical protein
MNISQLTLFSGAPVNQTICNRVKASFPISWFDLVKQNSTEYKAVTKSMTIGKIDALNETLESIVICAFVIMLGSSKNSQAFYQLFSSTWFK